MVIISNSYAYTDYVEYPASSSLVVGRTIADNFNRKELNSIGAVQSYDIQFLGSGQIGTIANGYCLVRADEGEENYAGFSAVGNTINPNPDFNDVEINGIIWKSTFRPTSFTDSIFWQFIDILEGVIFDKGTNQPNIGVGYEPDISPNYLIRVSTVDNDEIYDTGINPVQGQIIKFELEWLQDGTVNGVLTNQTTGQTVSHTFESKLILDVVNALTYKSFVRAGENNPIILNIYNWSITAI